MESVNNNRPLENLANNVSANAKANSSTTDTTKKPTGDEGRDTNQKLAQPPENTTNILGLQSDARVPEIKSINDVIKTIQEMSAMLHLTGYDKLSLELAELLNSTLKNKELRNKKLIHKF